MHSLSSHFSGGADNKKMHKSKSWIKKRVIGGVIESNRGPILERTATEALYEEMLYFSRPK